MTQVQVTVSQTQNLDNVVYLSAFRKTEEPLPITPLPVPLDVFEFNGKQYPRPKTADEYLAMVKDVLGPDGEDDYRHILCAIMDRDYYEANYNYYHTRNGKGDTHFPIYKVVDAYLSFHQ